MLLITWTWLTAEKLQICYLPSFVFIMPVFEFLYRTFKTAVVCVVTFTPLPVSLPA